MLSNIAQPIRNFSKKYTNETIERDKIEDKFSIILIEIFNNVLEKGHQNRKKELQSIHELL